MISAFDDVLWLTEWQRKQWISVDPAWARFEHIFGNGIALDSFEPIRPRDNPYSCIWGSSYDRGLETLLNLWPTVKRMFPRATLDIYYGWQSWGKIPPNREAKLRAQMTALAKLDVREHGLVGHKELNRAYARASFWTYPCSFTETFCITALRAQYAGAVPVVIRSAALWETVKAGYICDQPEAYLDVLISALRNAERIPLSFREQMRDPIRGQFTWEIIAKKWKEVFDR